MLCSGICLTISSYACGHLVKYTGRIVVFSIAALINYAMIILMFLWDPKQSQMILLFVIGGFLGIADGIWQTQIIGMRVFSSIIAKHRSRANDQMTIESF